MEGLSQDNAILYFMNDIKGDIRRFDGRIDKLDIRMDRLESRMDKLNEKIDSNFKWTMGILVSFIGGVVGGFVVTISIILSN